MKRFALAAVVTLGGFGVVSACGDPYDGEEIVPAPDRDGGSDATNVDDSGSPSSDAAADVPTVKEAGADAASNPCDKDKDGFPSLACDGGDCDDDDELAKPTADYNATPPRQTTQGDWNCNGEVTKQYAFDVSCALLSTAVCAQIEGFDGDPGCGQPGSYVFCKTDGITCFVDTAKSGKRNQGCK